MGAPAQQRELHVRDYLRVLSRRRWPALAVFLITASVGTVRAYLAPPVYRASTRIMIEKTEVQNLAMVNPMYAAWDPDFNRTQVQIIRSAATAERAAKALAADERFRARYRRPGAGAPAPPALAKMIQGGIAAVPEKDSKIVAISYLSPEPELAALIVNAIVKAYVEQLFEMKMSYSRYAVEWMTGKAREEGQRLEQAERNLHNFSKANELITVENRVAVIPERLSELGLELTKAETRRRDLEDVSRRIDATANDPAAAEALPVVQADPAYQSLRAQLLKSEQNVLELAKKYGQKHPLMIAARQEAESLARKKDAEVRRVAASARTEYEQALAREEDLRRRLASGRGEALDANEKLGRYEELKRAVETNRQFYDTLMSRAKEESMTQQLQGVQVFTLEPAEAPTEPDGPRTARTVLLSLIVGLVGAVGMAFFVEYLDNTVRSPEDLEVKTGLPVIGVIPLARGRGRTIEAALLHDPRQVAAESYRALRTSILLSADEGPPKTLLVTSTAPEEGKTATAVNLAVALAHSGYAVLLVDADLRRPRVDKVFDIPNEHGLSDVLEGATPVPVDVGLKNLSVLPSGPVPSNPSELLGSKQMESLVRDLRERYDMVIFDSPPFLTVADALVLAKKLDAMLFVTRAERSTYDLVRRGLKTLRDLGVRPLGFVLNGYDERRSGAYYSYSNYYESAGSGKDAAGREPRKPRAL
jgi:capsular exopolysaccharide synthesis family protein